MTVEWWADMKVGDLELTLVHSMAAEMVTRLEEKMAEKTAEMMDGKKELPMAEQKAELKVDKMAENLASLMVVMKESS